MLCYNVYSITQFHIVSFPAVYCSFVRQNCLSPTVINNSISFLSQLYTVSFPAVYCFFPTCIQKKTLRIKCEYAHTSSGIKYVDTSVFVHVFDKPLKMHVLKLQ